MVRFIILCFVIICLSSCKESQNSAYSVEIPFSFANPLFLEISNEKYILYISTDGIVSSGSFKKVENYLVLNDGLSAETFLIEKKCQYLIIRNGRYKDLIFAKDMGIMESKNFDEDVKFLFDVEKLNIEGYLNYHKNSVRENSDQEIKLNAAYSNQNELTLELYTNERFAYIYNGLFIEYGTFHQEQDTLFLAGESYMEERNDNSEKQHSVINSFKNPVFKVFIINDSTLSLGTLPFARINNLVTFKDTVQLPVIQHGGFID